MGIKQKLLLAAILLLSVNLCIAQQQKKTVTTTKAPVQESFIGKKDLDFTSLGFSICTSIMASQNHYTPTDYGLDILVKGKSDMACHKQGKRYIFLTKRVRESEVKTYTIVTDQLEESVPVNAYVSFEKVVNKRTRTSAKYLVKYSTAAKRVKLLNVWAINEKTSKLEAVTITPDMQIEFEDLDC